MHSRPISVPNTSTRNFEEGSGAAHGPQPTRIRWRIVALLGLITALTYVDRLNLSIAGKYIQDDYGFSTPTMAVILSAFVWGYALFQVPGGWMGDRYGPRSVLTVAILWWSVFTATTGLAPRLPLAKWFGVVWSFVLVRFLIGVGEAAAFPNSNKIVANWMGAERRGVGSSFFITGVGVGGTLTPLVIAWIMQRSGWRMSFYSCGVAGVIVAIVWRLYATNRPEEHPRVNGAELELIHFGGTPIDARSRREPLPKSKPSWKGMLSDVSVWGLILSYFFICYPAYIYYTWFFIYLVRVRGLSVTQGGFWGATPFIAITLLAPFGGWLSDRAVVRFGKRRGRQSAVWFGAACSALLLWLGSHTASNTIAILFLACAAGFNIFATASWWATCIDLTRSFSGSLSGLMNMCGNLGGALSPILTGILATRFGWTRALDFAALVTLAAGALWLLVNAGQSFEESNAAREPAR